VKQKVLRNGVLVSTVWLGLDHGFGLSVRPLIFESMAFSRERTKRQTIDCQRYATKEEAKAGHYRMCRRWEGKEGQES
jgi:hypothetical protein